MYNMHQYIMSVFTYEVGSETQALSLESSIGTDLSQIDDRSSDASCCLLPEYTGASPTIDVYHTLPLDNEEKARQEQIFAEVRAEAGVRRVTDSLLAVGDANTWRHCNRVARLMVYSAVALGMTDAEIRLACRLGLMHDGGKANPDVQKAINSPEQMNPKLFEVIKQHPMYGVSMTRAAGQNLNVQQGVGNHHSLQTTRQAYGVYDRITPVAEADGKHPDLASIIGILGCCDPVDAVTVAHDDGSRGYQRSSVEQFGNQHAASIVKSINTHPDIKAVVSTILTPSTQK